MTFLLLQKCFRAAGPAGLAGRGQVRAAARERVQVPERGGGAHASHPVGPVADGQPARLHAAAEGGAGEQRHSPAAIAGTMIYLELATLKTKSSSDHQAYTLSMLS